MEQLKPNGQPFDTTMTAQMEDWLCRGGVNPRRVVPLGVPLEILLLLWNLHQDGGESHTLKE